MFHFKIHFKFKSLREVLPVSAVRTKEPSSCGSGVKGSVRGSETQQLHLRLLLLAQWVIVACVNSSSGRENMLLLASLTELVLTLKTPHGFSLIVRFKVGTHWEDFGISFPPPLTLKKPSPSRILWSYQGFKGTKFTFPFHFLTLYNSCVSWDIFSYRVLYWGGVSFSFNSCNIFVFCNPGEFPEYTEIFHRMIIGGPIILLFLFLNAV